MKQLQRAKRGLIPIEDLLLRSEDRDLSRPLRVSVQGNIVFIGDYWFTAQEARELREWLNKVLP